jgi:hypothetical protein
VHNLIEFLLRKHQKKSPKGAGWIQSSARTFVQANAVTFWRANPAEMNYEIGSAHRLNRLALEALAMQEAG